VVIKPVARQQVDASKTLTRLYVIFGHDTLSDREGQRRAVEVVFDVLWDAARTHPEKRTEDFRGTFLFPRSYRAKLSSNIDHTHRARVIVDYVAGMSEPELRAKYSAFQMLGEKP
jgi:dGTP triphosphohydrolase